MSTACSAHAHTQLFLLSQQPAAGLLSGMCRRAAKYSATQPKHGIAAQPSTAQRSAAQGRTGQHRQHRAAQGSTGQHRAAHHITSHHITSQQRTAQHSAAQHGYGIQNLLHMRSGSMQGRDSGLTEGSGSEVQPLRHSAPGITEATGQGILCRCSCLEVAAHAVEVKQDIIRLWLTGHICCCSPLLQRLLRRIQQTHHFMPACATLAGVGGFAGNCCWKSPCT